MLEHYIEPSKKSNQARHPVTKQITKGSPKANQVPNTYSVSNAEKDLAQIDTESKQDIMKKKAVMIAKTILGSKG